MRQLATVVLLVFATFALWPSLAAAQETGASISGTITDGEGEPLPGATVVAVHEPTGTEYGRAAGDDGTFTLRGLRTGGPYTVTASFVGYRSAVESGITLGLGQAATVDLQLEEGAEELDPVEVISDRQRTLSRDRTGTQTTVSEIDIERNPTIDRSLADFARLSPLATGQGIGFAGREARLSSITVDGATLSDFFGLGGSGGSPGGQVGTEPISLDAIQEFNIDVAPYDVRLGNFTGGRLNAVTRSGSNTFEGSVYFQGRNEQFVGGGPAQTDFPEFGESFIGGRLGGPIIEDELFFFVNAEARLRNEPIAVGIEGSGEATTFPAGPETFNAISSTADDLYGIPTGDFDPFTSDQDNYKVMARLDWNISRDHDLMIRHNFVDGDSDSGVSRGSSFYSFDSRAYLFDHQQNTTTAELTSTLSDQLFNEARFSYTGIRDERDLRGFDFPQIGIELDGGNTVGFGAGRFNHANRLDQDIFEFTNNLTWDLGDHTITFGTQNQYYSWSNLFIQDYFGNYEFRPMTIPAGTTIENPFTGAVETFDEEETISGRRAFELGIPETYTYSFSALDDDPRPEADAAALQLGFYAQDEWRVSSDLQLTFGLRADIPVLPDDPLANDEAEAAFGINTSEVPSTQVLWQPRFGFNYDASGGDRTTQIRGGAGIFAGQPPFVWISNQYSNTGADFNRLDISQRDDAGVFDDQGVRLPVQEGVDRTRQPGNLPPERQVGDGDFEIDETTEINLTDPDFSYPQVFRANLALDQQLPLGVVGTVEGTFTRSINDIDYVNLNVEDNPDVNPIDGRPVYQRINEEFTNALLMTNTSEGHQYSVTLGLERRADEGLGGQLSYTFQDAFSVHNLTSSRAISNWRRTSAPDFNDRSAERSAYVSRHRVLANLSYDLSYDRFSTVFSAIYDGRSGTPFSWTYNGDVANTGEDGPHLIYVPEEPDEIFLTSDNWNALDSFIDSESSLRERRGEIAERATAFHPWNHQFDLEVRQVIETFEGQRLEISATLLNALNFLNSDWGVRRLAPYRGADAASVQLLDFDRWVTEADLNDTIAGREVTEADLGKPVVSFDEPDEREDLFDVQDVDSRWQLQIGLRYTF